MSLDLSGEAFLVMLIVPAVLIGALAAAPRWFVGSLGRHALWRLRDDVVDDSLSGALPGDHPAVRELIARTEWAIEESHSLDMLHLLVWIRARRALGPETVKHLRRTPTLDGLTPEQKERMEGYRMGYDSLAVSTTLLSSWIGLFLVLRYTVSAGIWYLRDRMRDRAKRDSPRVVIYWATKKYTAETTLGRSAQEFISVEGPETKTHAAV